MTWNDIADRVYRTLDEDSGNSHWDKAALIDLIKEGELEFVRETEYFRAEQTQNLAAQTAQYDLPDDLIRIITVKAAGKLLEAKNEAELNDIYRLQGLNWDEIQGEPLYYLVTGNRIRLLPGPNASINNGLKIYYLQFPDQSQESPSIALSYQKALVFWGVSAALNEDQANKEQALFYERLFQRELNYAKKALNSKDRKSSFRDNLRYELNAYWKKW